jgi:hypothetical protein
MSTELRAPQSEKGSYVPITPGDTPLIHLASSTEEQAWTRLLEDARHMPYPDKDAFQKRGYSVEFWPGWEADNG